MPLSREDFRHALSRFASGVCVVTTVGPEGELYGMTVSAFCSVSLEPPLILICIEKTANTHRGLLDAGYFVVNLLTDEQLGLSERFALPSPADFEGVGHVRNSRGIPMLDGCLANLECTKTQAYDGGDHTIFIGEVEGSHIRHGMPLIYFRSTYGSLK